jgi:uncharacterized protein with ParB-like and HNH nuclease domain/predicted transport protein
MKAQEIQFLEFLKNAQQFRIPIYQRTYSWTDRECLQIWDDILRVGEDRGVSAHFIGSVVYIQEGIHSVGSAPYLVIDGQQRLTTVTLILEALARFVGDGEPVSGFSAEKIRNYYLKNHMESGEGQHKLLLTQTDRNTLLALVNQKELPRDHSVRLVKNFAWIEKRVKRLGGELENLCMGLSKLIVVGISLDRDHDNPQLIFESMNSTGRELSQADLIRNFILMGLGPNHQEELFESQWRPMEVDFGQEAYGDHFDGFMRHFLTVKTGEIPKIREVYEAFKAYARQPIIENAGVNELVKEIRVFARYYCAMLLGGEQNPKLRAAFLDLKELKSDVTYPFLIEVYHDYNNGLLSVEEFSQIVRLVESYVFRRAICNIPTNSMNKTFGTLSQSLNKDRYFESVQAAFLLLPSYRRFPNNEEFIQGMPERDLYNFRSRTYWLRRMENHERKELVSLDDYTIEHIMPQNENLSSDWKESLGPEWERIHLSKLHTLGNLTLTRYNSEYSDRPFVEKREMEGGFKHSPLRLNDGLGSVEKWDEQAIETRARRLAALASEIWISPSLDQEILASHRPESKISRSIYSLEDHPTLSPDTPLRGLFDALRAEILSLDSCIREEPLKLYIAYKAETNVVDVIPRSKQLLLAVNMPFRELRDPSELTKDVSGMGRWGNGEIELRVSSLEDIPYALGVIRQSLEKQLGSNPE